MVDENKHDWSDSPLDAVCAGNWNCCLLRAGAASVVHASSANCVFAAATNVPPARRGTRAAWNWSGRRSVLFVSLLREPRRTDNSSRVQSSDVELLFQLLLAG